MNWEGGVPGNEDGPDKESEGIEDLQISKVFMNLIKRLESIIYTRLRPYIYTPNTWRVCKGHPPSSNPH